MKILIVDDDPSSRELVSIVLAAAGHQVTAVETAAEALAAEGPDAWALMVVDLGLPDLDGLELIRRVRQAPAGDAVPVLVCSAFAGEADRRDAIDAGGDHFLAKPFRRQQLLEAVDQTLERRDPR